MALSYSTWNPYAEAKAGQAAAQTTLANAQAQQLQQGQQTSGSSSTLPTWLDPAQAARIGNTIEGVGQQAAGQYNDFISNPTAHPLYQQTLQGVLQGLQPSIEQGYQDLNDQFRSAGQLGAGAHGIAAGKYAGEVNRNQSIAASEVLAKMFPQVTQALQQPMTNLIGLNEANKGEATTTTQTSGTAPGETKAGSHNPWGAQFDWLFQR